jgi:PAS domain S-box-containing protein
MDIHSKVQLFLDKIPNPILAISAEVKILYCNPASLNLWPWLVVEPEATLPEDWPDLIRQAIQTNQTIQIEYRQDQQIFSCLFTPIVEEGWVQVYGQEITKLRQVEQKLQASEELFRQLAENIYEASWVTTLDLNHMMYVSPACEEIWGRPIWQLYAQAGLWLAAIHPEDRDRIATALKKAEQFSEEYRIVRPDGSIRWIRSRAFPVRNENGLIYRIAGVSEDITNRKQTEAELIQRNRELMILQTAGAAVSSSLDIFKVIKAVTSEMVYLLDMSGCVLYEWNENDDTISLLDEYSSNNGRDRGRPGEMFSLADYPLTRQVLIERRVRQVTLDQPDVSPAELNYMQKSGANTLLILPMVFQDNVMGLIEMVDSKKRTFTDHAILLAQILANQAASAIENARLYERIHQRVNELAILTNISQAINSTLDLEEILNTITDLTVPLMDVEAASVALCEEATPDCLNYVAASGSGADFIRGERLALGEGITGWVVQYGQTALVPDVSQDSRFSNKFDQVSGFTTRSMLCVPLKVKGQTTGAISIINKRFGQFDEDDVHLLSSLATPAAIAIEHARLYKQAQQEIAERKRRQN